MKRAALPVLEEGCIGNEITPASGAPVMVIALFEVAVERCLRVAEEITVVAEKVS
jgi:hypothetical protein